MGLAACVMLCLEWWTYDMQSFMASFISPETTGIQSMMMNTIIIFACVAAGL